MHDPNQKITEALISFIAGSLSLISVVENSEFKLLIESLNPRYQLRSRNHFSTKLLLQRSTKIQNSLKNKVAECGECLTIGLWSNRQMKGFILEFSSYWIDVCNRSWCHVSGSEINNVRKPYAKNMKEQ